MSKVTFTESIADTAFATGYDMYIDGKAKKIEFNELFQNGIVCFGEGMISRDWIRNKMEPLQTEPIIKNIGASAASKTVGFGIYDWFVGKDLGMGIVKKSLGTSIGTGAVKYFFNI